VASEERKRTLAREGAQTMTWRKTLARLAVIAALMALSWFI